MEYQGLGLSRQRRPDKVLQLLQSARGRRRPGHSLHGILRKQTVLNNDPDGKMLGRLTGRFCIKVRGGVPEA